MLIDLSEVRQTDVLDEGSTSSKLLSEELLSKVHRACNMVREIVLEEVPRFLAINTEHGYQTG